MKKIIFAVILILTFFINTQAKAGEVEKPWSVGVIGGLGLGFSTYDDEASNACTGSLCFDALFEGFYAIIPVMATASYQFTDLFALRGSLGVDIYGGDYYDNAPSVLPAGELFAMFHFRKKRALFHLYGLAGLRFPTANPALGLGNQFTVSDKVSIWVEAIGSSIGLDTKFETRVGVVMHF
jgi:hypothetical protein